MNNINFFDAAKLFLIPFFVVYIPILIGQRYGNYRSTKSADLQQGPVGAVIGTAFGLLGFMLALTFQIAANRYSERKDLLLEEVSNIRTTYLRAGLIEEPIRSDTKNLLTEYADIRIYLAREPSKLDSLLSRSQLILDNLWNYTETLAEKNRSSEIYALFTTSVNDLVTNYNLRITMTLEYRIPVMIFGFLYVITFFCMFSLGYFFGISGKGSFRINILLAIIFAMVIFLIIALDRPETGLAKLNQKPMLTLQKQLHDMQSKEKNK
jgi:hypothetical protein